jgi:hypothetical protein
MAISNDLSKACILILHQLRDLVHQLHESDFVRPSEALSRSTIGQHLRHTLEFFICLEQGFEQGLINYDKRAHDKIIEADKYLAISTIDRMITFVSGINTNKTLTLEVGYDLEKEDFITIETNALRELIYNIEHAVHHMAIMKIGIREVASYVNLPSDFGIAASTIRYHEAAVQSSR